MIESLAALAGRRPIAVTVLAFVIAILGIISWKDLPLDLFPDIQSPTVLVSVSSGDRPAEQMEQLYGERIEQLLFTVPGISSIEQIVRSGRLICRVTFSWNTDVDIALVDVNRAVAFIASDPEVDEVKVQRFDTKQLPIVILGLSAESDGPSLAELRRLAKRQIAPGLEQLEGVAEVRVSGGRVKQVEVQVDPIRIKAYGITINEVMSRISASNVDFNAGTLEDEDKILLVRGKSRLISPQDVERVVVRFISTEGDAVTAIRVKDIAKVAVVDAEISNLVRVDGREGVGLFIYKEAGANTVSVSKILRDSLPFIEKGLPGISIKTISDEAALVEDSISDVESTMLFGIILSITLLMLFLRSVGLIVIVIIAVPVSLLTTIFAMGLSGLSLNLMTLGGLALGAGMLVDNSIVVIESIFRRRAAGDSPIDAATKGTGMVGGAILASTLTTCIVFLPVLFIQGIASKLVSGISFTVVVSLIASLFVAIFLIPALSVSLLPKGKIQHIDPGSKRLESFVFKLLAKPGKVILITILLVAIAITSLSELGTELLPPEDPRQFTLRITAPAGQQIESTEFNVSNVEAILAKAAGQDLEAILSEVGRLDDNERLVQEQYTAENTASLRVRLADGGISASKVVEAAAPAIEKLYGTEVDWQLGSSALTLALGKSGAAIEILISGNSLEDLRYGAEKIQNQLQQTDALWNVQTSFEGAPKELHIKLNRKLADGLGVSQEIIRPVIAAALNGLKVTTLSLGDETRDVLITLPEVDSEQILNLSFLTSNGKLLTIGDFSEIELKPGAHEILRKNQRRVARVTALIRPGYTNPEARQIAQDAVLNTSLMTGTTAILAGEEAERLSTVNELSWAAALAMLLVLMVLAGSFESFLLPVAILASIPIAIIGVSIVLVPQGEPIGVMAMLGFVVLVGVVVNDAILLTQTARNLIQNGTEQRAALARAVSLRLRPIIMTTATTVLSLLPLALSSGEAAQLRSPLAWTVVGGIIASTIGCLFVIPCIYLSLDKLKFRLKKTLFSKSAQDSI